MQSIFRHAGCYVLGHTECVSGVLLPQYDVKVLLILCFLLAEGQYEVAMVTGRAVEVEVFLLTGDV